MNQGAQALADAVQVRGGLQAPRSSMGYLVPYLKRNPPLAKGQHLFIVSEIDELTRN